MIWATIYSMIFGHISYCILSCYILPHITSHIVILYHIVALYTLSYYIVTPLCRINCCTILSHCIVILIIISHRCLISLHHIIDHIITLHCRTALSYYIIASHCISYYISNQMNENKCSL